MKTITGFTFIVIMSCIMIGQSFSIPTGPTINPPFSYANLIDVTRYFPMEVGIKWTYEITIGEKNPVVSSIARGNIGNTTVVREQRGTLVIEEGKIFNLTIEVKEVTQLEGKQGVELEITEDDDFKLFRGADRVVWILREKPTFAVFQILVSQPEGEESIFSVRPLITPVAMEGKHPSQGFLTPIRHEGSSLHLLRMVGSTGPDVDNGFTEHFYYEKDVGMVKLVQKRDGVVSMTWKLIDFSFCQ